MCAGGGAGREENKNLGNLSPAEKTRLHHHSGLSGTGATRPRSRLPGIAQKAPLVKEPSGKSSGSGRGKETPQSRECASGREGGRKRAEAAEDSSPVDAAGCRAAGEQRPWSSAGSTARAGSGPGGHRKGAGQRRSPHRTGRARPRGERREAGEKLPPAPAPRTSRQQHFFLKIFFPGEKAHSERLSLLH